MKGLRQLLQGCNFLMIPPRKLKSEDPVHNTLERFENGPFAPKTRQIFSNAHATLEKLKPQQSAVVLYLCLRKTCTWWSWRHSSRKAPFSECFPSTWKRKADISKFLGLKERSRKASFSYYKFIRFSVDAALNLKCSVRIMMQNSSNSLGDRNTARKPRAWRVVAFGVLIARE